MPKKPLNLNSIREKYERKFGAHEPVPMRKAVRESGANADSIVPRKPMQQDIRFLSAIDSKPIDPPFLKLISFDEFIAKNAEKTDIRHQKKQKGQQKTSLSIEKTEYDESIRKRGIYRILDEKLMSYITEYQYEYEKIKDERNLERRKMTVVKTLGKKATKTSATGEDASDAEDDNQQ